MYQNIFLENRPKFSVLMSVYKKEKPEYLRECFQSLCNQSVKADEWVIVKDGPLSEELESVIEEYRKKYPHLIKIVLNQINLGLGLALRKGVPACSYELIARMDTDDICCPNRFEKQLAEFMNDKSLDICGSYIKEFEGSIDHIVSERLVPLAHKNICEYQKRRSAFNHMTVMYKKDSVLKAGNYEDAPLMEDDMLWTRMILAGCKCKNINDYLVYARAGRDMIDRRGGFSYFLKYRASRKKVYQLGLASYSDYAITIFVQFIVALIPSSIRRFVFIKLLRK